MPKARPETRQLARRLREQGSSIKRIAAEIGASVGSVSMWTRDIDLTEEQRAHLCRRSAEIQRAAGETNKRKAAENTVRAQQEARDEWPPLKGDSLFQFGIALYIAEGRKGQDGSVSLANTDPRVLRATQVFFRLVGIEDRVLRVNVQVPEGGHTPEDAVAHWASELGLSHEQFNKVVQVPRRKKGNKYPFGTCTIKTSNIHIKRKINVWMDLALEPWSADPNSGS